MVSHNIATSGAKQYNVEFKLELFNRTTGNSGRPSNAVLSTKYGSSSTDSNMLCNLWLGAYELAQQRDGELMTSYKNILETTCTGLPPKADEDLLDPQYVERLVKKLLEFRTKNEIKISFMNANTGMQEQIEKLAKFLIWSDSMVDALVATHPHVALAWSGATIFIQLHTKDTAYDDVLLKGYNIVGDIQIFWKTCGESYLDSRFLESCGNLEDELTKLYSLIIEYQARVLCHLTKPGSLLSRSFEYFSGSNDWEARIASIQELDQSCLNLISAQQEAGIRRDSERQLQEIQISRQIQSRILHTIEEDIQDKKQQDLLHDLANVSKNYARYKDINPERVSGTCEWFLTDRRFREWRDSQSGELLWVSAGPGCGKSVLSKVLIDEGLLNSKTTITISPSTITKSEAAICYFFFKEAGDGLMDSAHALCALLHQLFTYKSTSRLIEHGLLSHKNLGQTLAQRTSDLWGILVECAKNSPVPIICVLDALDECKEEGKGLINLLQRFYSPSDNSSIPTKLKFLITSRPYDSLQFQFTKISSSIAYLHLDGDEKLGEISREINAVIDFKMEEIAKGFLDEDRDKIIHRLKSMENRTYLWLHLTFDIIEKNRSAHRRSVDIEEFLSTLPSEVTDAYEKILSRSQNERMVEALLQIILVATRPLTLDETNCALALAIEEKMVMSYKNMKLWSQDDFKTTVKNLCGLFISTHDSKLSFIHQTAREFLVLRDQTRTGVWKGRLNLPESHGILSKACINYLQILDPSCRSPKQFYPLFSYAINNWHLHFSLQDAQKTEILRKSARELCRKSKPQAQFWVKEYHSRMIEASWADLHLASHLGLAAVVYDILEYERPDVNAKGGSLDDQSTPLLLSIKRGHLGVMEVLLQPVYKAEIIEDDIACAASNKINAESMMNLLLEKRGGEIKITEWILVNVVRNRECGAAVLALLLSKHRNEVKITDWVAESAVTRGSVNTVSLILHKCNFSLKMTSEVRKGMIQNGKDMSTQLLKYHTNRMVLKLEAELKRVKSCLYAKQKFISTAALKFQPMLGKNSNLREELKFDDETSNIHSDHNAEIAGGRREPTDTDSVETAHLTISFDENEDETGVSFSPSEKKGLVCVIASIQILNKTFPLIRQLMGRLPELNLVELPDLAYKYSDLYLGRNPERTSEVESAREIEKLFDRIISLIQCLKYYLFEVKEIVLPDLGDKSSDLHPDYDLKGAREIEDTEADNIEFLEKIIRLKTIVFENILLV